MKISQKKNFIHWYYTDGFRNFWRGGVNVLRSIPEVFSMKLLLRTLFSPWHRDVSLRQWDGIQIARSLQLFTWNLFSRLVGSVVRACVILAGVCAMIFFALLLFCLFLMYFCAPGILLLGIILLFLQKFAVAAVLLLTLLLVIVWARASYGALFHVPYKKMDLLMLAAQPWFYRVWERIGVSRKDVPDSVLTSLDALKKFLRSYDLSVDEAQEIISWEMDRQIEREVRSKPFARENLQKLRPIGLYWHYGFTNLLNRFSYDFSRRSSSNHGSAPFYGHQSEMEMLTLVLSRPRDNNVILLGDPGVGRKSIVHELGRRIRTGRLDGTRFMTMRLLEADIAAAVAHAVERGLDPEYTVENYFHEAAHAGNVILFLENFEQYMENSRGFSYPIILEKYASLPTFRIIAITTEEAFHNSVESNDSMLAHFELIHVTEMDEATTIKSLFMAFYSADHTVFTYAALREVITLSGRYLNDGPLPGRAVSLATEVELYWQKNSRESFITPEIVQEYITHKTGIPVGQITEAEQSRLLSLEDIFHKSIIGQNEAVQSVAQAVRRMRSGTARPNRPAGSFLFLGPTGVGKTEMAKTLAKEYFGDAENVIRLDMSEFQGPDALDLLIGSRRGNVKGRLSTLVEEHPYSIVLLDELEKANPRIFDIFLQILDEGAAHDGFGRKLNFTSMIIIATSNVGSRKISEMIEANVSQEDIHRNLIAAVSQQGVFRPEFLNRFDDIVVFHPIGQGDVVGITDLLLEKFKARILADQNIQVSFGPDVRDYIIDQGFEPAFGARSILRYIDDTIADAFARKIISGSIHRGDDLTLTVSDIAR